MKIVAQDQQGSCSARRLSSRARLKRLLLTLPMFPRAALHVYCWQAHQALSATCWLTLQTAVSCCALPRGCTLGLQNQFWSQNH